MVAVVQTYSGHEFILDGKGVAYCGHYAGVWTTVGNGVGLDVA